jgi:hypothetical protein
MKISSESRGHFRWRGLSYNPEGRRSSTFQCEDCHEVIKEYDDEILATLELHDQRKHGPPQTDPSRPADA